MSTCTLRSVITNPSVTEIVDDRELGALDGITMGKSWAATTSGVVKR